MPMTWDSAADAKVGLPLRLIDSWLDM
jgi:hypothetical protein